MLELEYDEANDAANKPWVLVKRHELPSLPSPTKSDGSVLVARFYNVSFSVSRMSHNLVLILALEVSTRIGRSACWLLLWLWECEHVLDVLSAV